MTGSSLYDFDASATSEAEKQAVELSVNTITQLIEQGKLQDRLASKIIDSFFMAPTGKYPKIVYDQGEEKNEFNLEDEIYAQIAMLRKMRTKLTTDGEDGELSSKVTFRDVKEVISACSSVMGSLMKFHKDAKTIERNKAVEEATISAMNKMAEKYEDKDLIPDFLKTLEEALERL